MCQTVLAFCLDNYLREIVQRIFILAHAEVGRGLCGLPAFHSDREVGWGELFTSWQPQTKRSCVWK